MKLFLQPLLYRHAIREQILIKCNSEKGNETCHQNGTLKNIVRLVIEDTY